MNFETVLYYKSQQSSGADGANNGNICRTPPPVQTSSVSVTYNYLCLYTTCLLNTMNVMLDRRVTELTYPRETSIHLNRLDCDWSKNTMGRPVFQPVVWGKERRLTERLEIEPGQAYD